MITISLCMIVKNEAYILKRILDQIKPIVDEIIIVDTGSTDQTREIASQYTTLLFDYSWDQDFSAARNFACSKATMDYWIWLDADDFIPPEQQKLLLDLKENLNPAIDVVMMKYLTGFDIDGNVTFSYYRERMLKNKCGFRWSGKVHETVTPHGTILYSPIAIEHRKSGSGDPNRNLNIYTAMLQKGEKLEPRHQFYYARELYYHKQYEEAIKEFFSFLNTPDGWIENKIDACLQMSFCYEYLKKNKERLEILLYSFTFDIPRAEICCEIGRYMMEHESYRQAIFWFQQALASEICEDSGAFIQKDYYGYIPSIQLCICYNNLGEYEKAFEYHKKSMKWKPNAKAVQLNQIYFEKRFHFVNDA